MPKKTILTIICAWCGKYMGRKDGQGVEGVTHSICDDCKAKWKKDCAADLGEKKEAKDG